ncbi:FAD:protein FMN transferase [Paenibacillus sp. FSL R10-2782]|uniref:FAD:protein FMN transferase n=1 Tax=Paenibacillus sp. FSL R10-2782 TaxID=2954661 RepID=UPI0031589F8C
MKRTKLYMDTAVSIQIVTGKSTSEEAVTQKMNQAFEAFQKVEQACSRFSPDSELMSVCQQVGVPVSVSPFLFEPLKFALEIAKWTDGIFDPTVGKIMEYHGFNRHYLTGQSIESPSAATVTYRDIILNEQDRTLCLQKPLVIDLGAVAKGFAIDLAAHELKEFEGFVVNAGGDLFAGGVNDGGEAWEIGIQHPERKEEMVSTVLLSNEAICTSGGYERKSAAEADVHHLIDPKTKRSPKEWVSSSVIAPFAMMADAFSTASFLLGAAEGQRLMEQAGLQGILITSDLQLVRVGGL